MSDPLAGTPAPAEPWHALLAPLPEWVVPVRKPIASPDVLASPAGAAIAGWEQVTIELSAGAAGLRVVGVVVDADDVPISASDWVMHRIESGDGRVTWHHFTVGGRLEPDGTFRGTRWHTIGVQAAANDEPTLESTPSAPDETDIEGIAVLVAELLRRAPPRATPG